MDSSHTKIIPVVSVEQISAVYGFHPNTVRSWLQLGLKYYRRGPGGKVYIPVKELSEFLNAHYKQVALDLPTRVTRVQRGLKGRRRRENVTETPS